MHRFWAVGAGTLSTSAHACCQTLGFGAPLLTGSWNLECQHPHPEAATASEPLPRSSPSGLRVTTKPALAWTLQEPLCAEHKDSRGGQRQFPGPPEQLFFCFLTIHRTSLLGQLYRLVWGVAVFAFTYLVCSLVLDGCEALQNDQALPFALLGVRFCPLQSCPCVLTS